MNGRTRRNAGKAACAAAVVIAAALGVSAFGNGELWLQVAGMNVLLSLQHGGFRAVASGPADPSHRSADFGSLDREPFGFMWTDWNRENDRKMHTALNWQSLPLGPMGTLWRSGPSPTVTIRYPNRYGMSVAAWPAPVLLAMGGVMLWRWGRRASRAACVDCGYPRSGLPADAPCPECGRPPVRPETANP